MKDFEKIGKKMPYCESDAYIDGLIDKCIEKSISQETTFEPKKRKSNVRRIVFAITSMAAVLLLGLVLFSNLNDDSLMERVSESKDLNQVLAHMSDEQVQELAFYTTEDIPEY